MQEISPASTTLSSAFFNQPIESVAFLGLGAMGELMAAHLPTTFKRVWVWNRTAEKAQQHAKRYGTRAVTLPEAVQADVIFSCLPTSQTVRELILANPPKKGSVWVDCTSGVPDIAQELAQFLQARGSYFLDAPVSGQTVGAQRGTLTVMVGGEAAALAYARPAIEPFAGLIEHVGASGAGFAVKAVNNMLMAVNLWAGAEGLGILKAHGVRLENALTCINASSGQSMSTQSVLPQRVLTRDFPLTFALELLAKDTRIAQALAKSAGLTTPITGLVQQFCAIADQTQPKPADFSTLVQLFEQWNHIELS